MGSRRKSARGSPATASAKSPSRRRSQPAAKQCRTNPFGNSPRLGQPLAHGSFRGQRVRRVALSLRRRRERPESDRVAMTVERGNAVLPHCPRRAGKQIGRAWLDRQRNAIPAIPILPPKAEAAGSEQRNSDHLVELGLVAMPADARSGAVFIDQHLLKGLHRAAKSLGDLVAQRFEKGWHRRRLDDFPGAIVIAKAESDDLTIGLIAVKVERLERKRGKLPREALLLVRRHQIGGIAKAFRQADWRAE